MPSEPLAPDKVCEHAEIRRRVRVAIAALPWRERTVIGRYYYSDLTMKQIGAEIGVNESRVSQLHTRAIRRLRERLGADFAPNALPTAIGSAVRQGGKLVMAKASPAPTPPAPQPAPRRDTGTESRGGAPQRKSAGAPRPRWAARRARRPRKAVAARMPEPVAVAS